MNEVPHSAVSRWNRISVHDVATTLDRLESAVREFGGIHHIARVNQAEVASVGGARVAPAEVVIIENPALVAQLASVDLELLSDLPIRVLSWQDPGGRTHLHTTPPAQIAAASDHPKVAAVREAIEEILGAWLDYAATDAQTAAHDSNGREREKTASSRELAAQFHPNFNSGRLDHNGALAHESIFVKSNGVPVHGRSAFVERLHRYERPFPGLQLRDRIIVEDGRSAAVMYVLQGAHRGPFAGRDGTGNAIEAFSGEIFDFDDQGLLTHLLTVTHLGHVTAQVRGQREVSDHQRIMLLPTEPDSPQSRESMIATAISLYERESREHSCARIDDETMVILDGAPERGPEPWQNRLSLWRQAFPDLTVTVDRTLQEGNRLVVVLTMRGSHEGPFETADGSLIPPTGRSVEFHTIDFLEFAGSDRIAEVVSIYNTDDIPDQIS